MGCHPGSTQSMDHDLSRSTDPPPPIGSVRFPILYQDVRLKDKRWVELSKSSLAPQPKPRKVSLRKYLEHSSARLLPPWLLTTRWGMMESWTYLSSPSLNWERMVDHLNQDPCADSVMDLNRETLSVGGERNDITGDEKVESRDEDSTTWAAAGSGTSDLDWDPRDPLFEFNDKNSGAT